jgi:hypothetical protein
MRVSLAPAHLRRPPPGLARDGSAEALPRPLAATAGPCVVLGSAASSDGLALPIRPAADSLFGPRGACLAGPGGPLFVCDTGHHRLMIWRRAPAGDGVPADMLVGQPDFEHEGRNARGEVGPATLNVPTGVAAAGDVLAVADAWNHRVLIWHGYPERSNRPADVVLGQEDFAGALANRGADSARADTLNWCYGVALIDGRLLVADTGNRRVLVWDHVPQHSGTPADLVLGQRDFTIRDENAGGPAGGLGMRWPHGIAADRDRLFVADAGNSRVMLWDAMPKSNGRPCDIVLGQADMKGLDHNRGAYHPTAGSLSMPYGLTVVGRRLAVADTANSRLVGYDLDRLVPGAAAGWLAGQQGFGDKGDNRWRPAVRDSLCWPYNVAACGNTLAVADSGNNRVMLWEAAP